MKRLISVLLCGAMILGLCACTNGANSNKTTSSSSQPSSKNTEEESSTGETSTQPPTETTTTEALKVSLSSTQTHLAVGATEKITASLNKKDEYKLEDLVWSSSNPVAITVDESGTITCHTVGKSIISAKAGTAEGKIEISSEVLVTSAIIVTPEITLNAGESAAIGATPQPDDATDAALHWSNSDKSVAAIVKNQVVGYSQGSCVLTVFNNRNEKLGEVHVTVNPAPPKPSKNPEYQNQIVAFSTEYDEGKVNRSTNLKIASQAITNTCLQPGEVFSFNAVVGPRTEDKGYKKAIVFNAGKEEKGLAGGICQVSSTLFNAALLSNFQIVERKCHSLKVKYVKLGRDAAISGNAQDLKFINTLDVPVCIEMECANGVITVRIYTYGTDSYPLPSIKIDSGGSGHNWWVSRTVDGVENYSASSHYGN